MNKTNFLAMNKKEALEAFSEEKIKRILRGKMYSFQPRRNKLCQQT